MFEDIIRRYRFNRIRRLRDSLSRKRALRRIYLFHYGEDLPVCHPMHDSMARLSKKIRQGDKKFSRLVAEYRADYPKQPKQ